MKILCPHHSENTPSCHIYSDSFFCFGCGAHGSLAQLGLMGKENAQPFKKYSRPEDIEKALDYIRTLPKKEIRGLELPYDIRGYYIVYPGEKYYMLRRWEATNAKKCYCPMGHSKPVFTVCYGSYSTPDLGPLFIVEGQINALSLAKGLDVDSPLRKVISPGGANDLSNKKYYHHYAAYVNIVIIVDEDAAGIVNGMQLKADMFLKGKNVALYTMPKDLNSVLQERGINGVQEEAKRAIDLLGQGTQ